MENINTSILNMIMTIYTDLNSFNLHYMFQRRVIY